MVATRSQVKSQDVEDASAEAILPQINEVQKAASSKPPKGEALGKTARGNKTKGATKKVKHTVKSAPIVVADSNYEVASTRTSAGKALIAARQGKAQSKAATRKDKAKVEPSPVETNKPGQVRTSFELAANDQSESPLLRLPLEIRSLIYKHAAKSCQASTGIKARNTLDFRVFPVPVIHYDKRFYLPAAQERNKHTLQNLMRTSQLMYDEAKAALYRNVPITVTLGTAGPKQAFNIGRRPVNFPGTDYLEELASCRTVKLSSGFRGDYVANKPEQVKEEGTAFLDWWNEHAETSNNVRLAVILTSYGVASYDSYNYGYGQSLSLKRFEDWLLSLSPATRKTVSFRLSLSIGWNGTYYLSEHVRKFWEKNQDLVRCNVTYSDATTPRDPEERTSVSVGVFYAG